MEIVRDGYAVARRADLLLFSVETANIEAVVRQYAPGMWPRPGA
jgi:prephenate dehydrogenase